MAWLEHKVLTGWPVAPTDVLTTEPAGQVRAEKCQKPLAEGSSFDDGVNVTTVKGLFVVTVQIRLLASLRRLGPLSPESEWAYVTLRERQEVLLQELTAERSQGVVGMRRDKS
jgi:hypothetical protein